MIALSGLFYASYIALWILVTVMALLMIVLLRHFGLVTMGTLDGVQRDGLPVGNAAPPIVAVTADGEPYAMGSETLRPRFIVFGAPGCEPCAAILPYLAELSEAAQDELEVTVVVPGPASAAELMARELGRAAPKPLHIVADDGSGLANDYRVRVTPFAFAVGDDGAIRAKGLCGDPVRLRDLLGIAGFDEAARRMNHAADDYIHGRELKVTTDNGRVGVA